MMAPSTRQSHQHPGRRARSRLRLRWRDRLALRSASRQVEARWRQEIGDTLAGLIGAPVHLLQPVEPHGRAAQVVALDAGGRIVVLAGLAPSGTSALEALATERGARLDGFGRYGRLWWLRIARAAGPTNSTGPTNPTGPTTPEGPVDRRGRSAVITASRLSFAPQDGGHRTGRPPVARPRPPQATASQLV